MKRTLSIALALMMVAAVVPAMHAGAQVSVTPVQDDEARECVDELIDVRIDKVESGGVTQASACGGGGSTVPAPVDVDYDLSDCAVGCDIREVPLVDPDFVPFEIAETPPVYTVECVQESGDDSTTVPLVSAEAECPIPGLQTGNTVERVPAQSIEEDLPEDFDVVPLATVTTGACLLTLEVTGPFGAGASIQDEPVPCAHP